MTEAFVTLATNDDYALGAMVLACSLKDCGTTRTIAIMITSGVSTNIRNQLSLVFDKVHEVNVLDSSDLRNLQLLSRPDLGVTFTKLHCWNLTCYSKAVFLDADTLVIQNIDELFEREEFSAAPDVGWPDCFNSGVFVFKPNNDTYSSLLNFALQKGSFDGGDQGLLNDYFSDWSTKDISNHLPFIYNTVSTSFYTYKPAYKRFGDKVKVVHFLGANKPWHQISVNLARDEPFIKSWNNVLQNSLLPKFKVDINSISTTLGKLSITIQSENVDRKQDWEKGNIDYMGADAFSNIEKKLDEAMETRFVDVKGKKPTIKVSKELDKNLSKNKNKKL